MTQSSKGLLAVLAAGLGVGNYGGLGYQAPSIRAGLPKKRPMPAPKASAEPRALPAELSRQQRRYLERKGLARGW